LRGGSEKNISYLQYLEKNYFGYAERIRHDNEKQAGRVAPAFFKKISIGIIPSTEIQDPVLEES
jgi:hypothetical protein